MAYRGLGPRRVTAVKDSTGNNTGNYTTTFDPAMLAIDVPWFELYRGVVEKATPGATATIYVDGYPTSANIFGSVAEWDPAQPPLLSPGSSVFFYWSTPATGLAPVTTLWFRYDDSIGAPT